MKAGALWSEYLVRAKLLDYCSRLYSFGGGKKITAGGFSGCGLGVGLVWVNNSRSVALSLSVEFIIAPVIHLNFQTTLEP